jgi:hypothetical protein
LPPIWKLRAAQLPDRLQCGEERFVVVVVPPHTDTKDAFCRDLFDRFAQLAQAIPKRLTLRLAHVHALPRSYLGAPLFVGFQLGTETLLGEGNSLRAGHKAWYGSLSFEQPPAPVVTHWVQPFNSYPAPTRPGIRWH